MIYRDRIDAGKQLATYLQAYAHQADTLIVALPRGGVVVGKQIAAALQLPLDITCPRKIGAPFNPELAIGAITETGAVTLSDEIIKAYNISESYIQEVIEKERKIAEWRLNYYRQNLPPRNLSHKTIILVDDGLATGSTMLAAIKTLRAEQVRAIIMAIPVAPKETLARLTPLVDKAICPTTPSPFFAVGQFYTHFDQTTDTEVIELLKP